MTPRTSSRTSRLRRPATVTVACLGAVALLATGCGGGHKKKDAAAAAPRSTPTASATPTPTTTPAPKPAAVNPLTGYGPVPKTPVIAVKIDDTEPGRPQRGINQADVVYIEAVEGGLTRLAAIYGTYKPTVGYVRSTRPSDPDLLLQYGKITEAYSGGAHDSLPRVRASGITSWSNDAGAPYYSRVSRSQSSYINLVLNLAKVAKKTKSNAPRSIGWTFSKSLAGVPVRTGTDLRTLVRGSNGSGTPVQFKWDTKLNKYVRYIGGVRQVDSSGRPVSATNVIVQSCRVVAHPADTDVNGNPSQFTYTVGTGKVSVFRNGRRIDGTWSRPKLTSGTTLKTTAGKALALNPGNTWVVLVTNGASIQG